MYGEFRTLPALFLIIIFNFTLGATAWLMELSGLLLSLRSKYDVVLRQKLKAHHSRSTTVMRFRTGKSNPAIQSRAVLARASKNATSSCSCGARRRKRRNGSKRSCARPSASALTIQDFDSFP